jgi:hypothetical protein
MPGDILVSMLGKPEDIARKTFCKVIMTLRMYKGDEPFTESFAINVMLEKVKFISQIDIMVARGKYRTRRTNITREKAFEIWKGLVRNGFISPSHRQMRDKLHPKIPSEGLQMWKIDPYRVTECEQTSWYKSSMRKREWRVRTSSLDVQRCRALRHIYSLFGSRPFTYEMSTSISKYMKMLQTAKAGDITERDRNIMKSVMQSFEMSSQEFLRVWNSLIRSNYITPWKKRTPKGYVKTNAYVVNKNYLRRCLSSFEV